MIDAHEKLDLRIQQWIFKQGWDRLREIQCLAIDPILSGNTVVPLLPQVKPKHFFYLQ